MENIFDIIDVTKKYDSFTLDKVNFACPSGSIMGLIGPNGAGKTTLINALMNLIKLDSGSIRIFGKDHTQLNKEDKENLAVVYDENTLPDHLMPKEVERIFREIYSNWDTLAFRQYLDRLEIPPKAATEPLPTKVGRFGLAAKAA